MIRFLFILLVVILNFNLKSQSALSIVGSITVTPGYTVTNGTTIYASANIKNVSTNTLTGSVGLKMAIDVSVTGSPNYVFRAVSYFNVNNFAPNAIMTQTVNDVAANYNQYKTDGNGVTIVVWPVFNGNNTSIADSMQTTIYVTLLNGINDIENFENTILKISNPISQNTKLEYNEDVYTTVTLLDVTGKTIQVIDDKILNTTFLNSGLYYLNFYNYITHHVVTKKILIE